MVVSFLGGWAAELAKQKIGEALLKELGHTFNPSDLERYLAQAMSAAQDAESQLFFTFDKDGPKGFPRFLSRFFKGRALSQLQKPLQEQGKPDKDLLAAALIQEAEDHDTFKRLPQEKVAPWMEAFVEAYFEKTNSALQLQLVRADYCEQILRVFDDVKFAGIAVEGQDIDRAERLAEIFVMPDLQEDENRLQKQFETEDWVLQAGMPKLGEPSGEETRQAQLLLEQQQEVLRLKARPSGRIMSAADLFSQGKTKQAVLLGVPGSGKTTLMNYFAVVGASAGNVLKATDEKMSRSIVSLSDCLPIIIRIRDLARHPDLSILEFVRYFAEKDLSVSRDLSGFFEHYLETGRALILLDGLDEVARAISF